jgi:hypothetical protein
MSLAAIRARMAALPAGGAEWRVLAEALADHEALATEMEVERRVLHQQAAVGRAALHGMGGTAALLLAGVELEDDDLAVLVAEVKAR